MRETLRAARGRIDRRLRNDADLARFMAENRGQVNGAEQVISLVIALTVGSIVAAFLLPIGLDELIGVDTSNYSSGAQSLWNILDVVIVLSLFLFFIAIAIGAANRV